jgi:hypothetical protein
MPGPQNLMSDPNNSPRATRHPTTAIIAGFVGPRSWTRSPIFMSHFKSIDVAHAVRIEARTTARRGIRPGSPGRCRGYCRIAPSARTEDRRSRWLARTSIPPSFMRPALPPIDPVFSSRIMEPSISMRFWRPRSQPRAFAAVCRSLLTNWRSSSPWLVARVRCAPDAHAGSQSWILRSPCPGLVLLPLFLLFLFLHLLLLAFFLVFLATLVSHARSCSVSMTRDGEWV